MKDNYEYKITLIVPIYNMEKFLRTCLDSIVEQTIDKDLIEVLLIDDGSTDGSGEIMHEYADRFPYMKTFHKENEGLSMTRNYGIKRAKGKYLMYLDSDDTLSSDSLRALADFFDEHYEEIDLVTYNELPVINGEFGKPHYRYNYLIKDGVYDLTEYPYVFCSQTRINVCVKNLGDDNVLFDFDRRFRQEDQKYCTQVLQRRMKLGYCSGATYYYLHQPDSIVRTIFFAYYIFETSMKFWEDLFDCYRESEVPAYIQALYLNDINWKTQSDILLPYHYPEEEFEKAKNRVQTLLDKIDDKVILGHPALDEYQKHYFLSSKRNNAITIEATKSFANVKNHNEYIIREEPFIVTLNRFKPKENIVEMAGIIQSPVLDYIDMPKLMLVVKDKDGNSMKEELSLRLSSYSYRKAKVITAKRYYFRTNVDTTKANKFYFVVETFGKTYKCEMQFNKIVPFGNKDSGTSHILRNGKKYTAKKNNELTIKPATKADEKKERRIQRVKYLRSDPELWLLRNRALKYKNTRIWLYYDCKGVFKDNGYYQLEHDIEINDGVKRYYILNEDNFAEEVKKYPKNIQKICVQFGSKKHIQLLIASEKIITAYVERNNYTPLTGPEYKKCLDIFDFPDIYYLQHGVLHAHVPWKYSADRMLLKKEVISTRFEEENLKDNYCFSDDQLIIAGMPRYDYIDSSAEHGKRILYAPSWRKHLVDQQGPQWITNEKKFLSSDFYKESEAFLNSEELKTLLEKNDLYLDFKPHPIFERYSHLYDITNPRVVIASKKVVETDYCIFITDFSSFVFDFAYLSTPIIYFMPDLIMFKAGMNYYRELDMPMTDGLGPFTQTKEELLQQISEIISNDFKPAKKYADRVDGLFFFKDNNQRDRIYKALIEDN